MDSNTFLTILHFFFISDTLDINRKDIKIQFGSEGEKEKHELDKDNCVALNPLYPKSYVYFLESIKVIYKETQIINFQYLVYIDKENNIIIDLDGQYKPSVELLFYAKEDKFTPTSICYKNKEYKYFQSYGNKKRTRIFFANVDTAELQYMNSKSMIDYNFNFNDTETYQALIRIYQENKFEISLTEMNSYLDINLNFQRPKKVILDDNFMKIEAMFIDFYDKYNKYFSINKASIDERKKAYLETKKSADKIKEEQLYELFENPDIYIYNDTFTEKLFDLFHIDFSLNQFLKLDKQEEDIFEFIYKKVLKCKKIEDKFYAKLKADKSINIEKKIKMLQTITIFLQKAPIERKDVSAIDYLNINKANEENPYYKSKQMLKKLISELTEESRLLEAFIYFDSKIIQNILQKNTQEEFSYQDAFDLKTKVEQPQFITEYGFNLMTVDEIKQHLLSLLPSVIIKIDTNINLRALYEDRTKIMVINELKMFNTSFESNEEEIFLDEPDHYIVPISMEILHEILGHAKLRLNKDLEKSPLVLRDSKYDFKVQKLMKKVKLDFGEEILVNQGESGRVLELYISENKNAIRKLKERTRNTEINDTKYWTGKNFNALHKLLNLDNENKNNINFNKTIILDDDNDDDDEFCTCMINH